MTPITPKKFSKILAGRIQERFHGISVTFEEKSEHGDGVTIISCPTDTTADLIMESMIQHLATLVDKSHVDKLESTQVFFQKLTPEMQAYGKVLSQIEGSIAAEQPDIYRSNPKVRHAFEGMNRKLRETPEAFPPLSDRRRDKIPTLVVIQGALIARLAKAGPAENLTESEAKERCSQFATAAAETYESIAAKRFLGKGGGGNSIC